MSIASGDTRFVVLAGGWRADSVQMAKKIKKERKKEIKKERKYSSKIYRPRRPADAGPGGLNKIQQKWARQETVKHFQLTNRIYQTATNKYIIIPIIY